MNSKRSSPPRQPMRCATERSASRKKSSIDATIRHPPHEGSEPFRVDILDYLLATLLNSSSAFLQIRDSNTEMVTSSRWVVVFL